MKRDPPTYASISRLSAKKLITELADNAIAGGDERLKQVIERLEAINAQISTLSAPTETRTLWFSGSLESIKYGPRPERHARGTQASGGIEMLISLFDIVDHPVRAVGAAVIGVFFAAVAFYAAASYIFSLIN